MIYDDLKKILKQKYLKNKAFFEESGNVIKENYFSLENINEEIHNKNDIDAVQYLKSLPKGFTYRPVVEYVELIQKIITDIQMKYLNGLTEEQKKYVLEKFDEYQMQIKMLPKEESLENSIEHWKILIDATKLYKFASEKNLENIRSRVSGVEKKEKRAPKTNQMTITDYEKELDRRAGKLRKRGIDALVNKIKARDDEEKFDEPKKTVDTGHTFVDHQKVLDSLKKFVFSVKDDLDEKDFVAAIEALDNAKKNPTEENIQLAKEIVDRVLEGR